MSIVPLTDTPVHLPESVARHHADCYLTTRPNRWDCHDPQCDDSTWDHDCPTGPCWVGASEPLPPRARR